MSLFKFPSSREGSITLDQRPPFHFHINDTCRDPACFRIQPQSEVPGRECIWGETVFHSVQEDAMRSLSWLPLLASRGWEHQPGKENLDQTPDSVLCSGQHPGHTFITELAPYMGHLMVGLSLGHHQAIYACGPRSQCGGPWQ